MGSRFCFSLGENYVLVQGGLASGLWIKFICMHEMTLGFINYFVALDVNLD